MQSVEVEGLQSYNGTKFPSISEVLMNDLRVSAVDAPFREEKDFLPGSLRFCRSFWEDVITKNSLNKRFVHFS